MTQSFEDAYEVGESDASGRIIDFWAWAASFAAFLDGMKDYC
jgi:hypothetical protein